MLKKRLAKRRQSWIKLQEKPQFDPNCSSKLNLIKTLVITTRQPGSYTLVVDQFDIECVKDPIRQ